MKVHIEVSLFHGYTQQWLSKAFLNDVHPIAKVHFL